MQYQLLSVAALVASVAAQTTEYAIDTVTENHTTDVTITQCSSHKCDTTVQQQTQTTITTTVDGVKTVLTTVCPLTESGAAAPTSAAGENNEVAPESASESDSYVDVTVTPTVTASTGVEATVTSQATFTSVYNSNGTASSSLEAANTADVSAYEGKANGQQAMVGLAGLAALAAVLL
ncbi:DEHA2A03498p [Debaryomyces hansenii CBS767]|jgi:hypothetical protein|uniref:DEHA2A03498p n=1 Tax=Debaryomyces hansenii (strain ATCC 36239 / CBS 767 / BCRC 21394 / JCM 1990 / NBRC 0083 / IGC 2968) TaxID=284592 RepID=Q6BZ75_DEBHA|nr:DEHA2A03498p [Debaryomyces hansenii CBS767]CAG84446.1 DEHA2A03498p [Debaryomyces hansenii CBS767]|eukprot:XP_456494.1 DEHA2A03498p [Debaryomyces hansenii CBS767]